MNIFEQTKSLLDIISVSEKYGINVINGTKALCPFHNDTNPSMSFKNDICTCWVCNETFDCIGLVSKLFNLTPIESVKKLNQDFKLGLKIGQPIPHETIRKIEQENELLKLFDKWEHESFIILTDYLHLLNNWKQQYSPTKDDFIKDKINKKYLEACYNLDYIDYLTDVFINGTYKDKVELYKTHRKEIEKIGNKIRKIRNISRA